MADEYRFNDRPSLRREPEAPVRRREQRDRHDDYEDDRPSRRRSTGSPWRRPNEDEMNSAMLCHLLAIFTGFIGPIIMWTSKKEQSKFVDWHGREALNFSLNLLIYNITLAIVLNVVAIITCGLGAILLPLMFVPYVFGLVMHIIALNAAKRGEFYRYPMTIRMIGPPEGMEMSVRPSGDERYASVENAEGDYRYADEPAANYSGSRSEGGTGGSSIAIWVICGLCLVLLLGCFGSIGGYFLFFDTGSSPTSKAMAKASADPPMMKDPFVPDNNDAGKPKDPIAAEPVRPERKPKPKPPEPMKPIEPVAPMPMNPQQRKGDAVEQALEDMKSPDMFARGRAADALARMTGIHEKRAEVARALEKQVQNEEGFARDAARRALPVWATQEQVPALLDLLKTVSPFDRSRIIESLILAKDDRAIVPIAECLKDRASRDAAAKAMRSFGPKAEEAVWPMLEERHFDTRRFAVSVLKDIGTKKSLAKLDAIVARKEAFVAQPAAEAAAAIRAREKN